MLSPPVPSDLVKSPPWAMKPGITQWKMLFLKWRSFEGELLSPVHREKKFKEVLGVCEYKPITTLPTYCLFIVISRNTFYLIVGVSITSTFSVGFY